MSLATTLAAIAAEPMISGTALAARLGVTRTAIWKHIEQLRKLGVVIEAAAGRGYRLAVPLELLDCNKLRRDVSVLAPGLLRDLEVFLSIDSTNAEVLRRRGKAAHGYVCLAEHQSAGRGRRGRSWNSPLAANIYLSAGWRFERGAAALAGLSLAAGVAVVEALRRLGYEEVGLKWPNDIVVRDRKLGGLLIELGGELGGPSDAVIGLGINVRMPAAAELAIDQPWIDLAGTGRGIPLQRQRIAAALAAAILVAAETFDRDGFAPYRVAFERFDALKGRAIRIVGGERPIDAVAAGVDGDGLLLARVDGEVRRFASGEVSVRPT